MCVGISHAHVGVMRGCAFIDNAHIRTRVNAENTINPPVLAAKLKYSKEKVSRRKAPLGRKSCEEMISFQSMPKRCVMTYRDHIAGFRYRFGGAVR
jgi:hypothetical protein